jgi:acetoin utilization protein AcuB
MFENVLVREWMSNPVISTTPDALISNAHEVMKAHDVRRLPVLKNDKLVGIVTIGDVREASPSDATTLSIWELNYLWAQLNVERIMSHGVLTVHPTTPILDAAELMLNQKVSGLPVVSESGELVGMITESDIFKMLVAWRVPSNP